MICSISQYCIGKPSNFMIHWLNPCCAGVRPFKLLPYLSIMVGCISNYIPICGGFFHSSTVDIPRYSVVSAPPKHPILVVSFMLSPMLCWNHFFCWLNHFECHEIPTTTISPYIYLYVIFSYEA